MIDAENLAEIISATTIIEKEVEVELAEVSFRCDIEFNALRINKTNAGVETCRTRIHRLVTETQAAKVPFKFMHTDFPWILC